MKRRFFAVIFLFASLGAGCAPKGPDITAFGLPDGVIARDLAVLPQDLTVYAEKAGERTKLLESAQQAAQDDRFDAAFFAAWSEGLPRMPKDEVFEDVRTMSPEKGFAENLRPWDSERWQALVRNCNMEAYGTLPLRRGIITTTALVRHLPTMSPYFRDPGAAGEGFPFDYMQKSALWIGTPVAITHLSLDRRWAYVQTRLVSGWVEAERIAAVDAKFIAAWRASRLGVIVSDDTILSVEGKDGDALSGTTVREARIGAILPLAAPPHKGVPRTDPVQFVLVPLRGAGGKAVAALASAPMHEVRKKPVPLTVGNVARIGNAMMGQPYGWGGWFGQRDCSAAMHDLFAPFGIWLPRNSRAQGQVGTRFALEGLKPEEKELHIAEKGVPFFSLVSLPGHVGLYLGTYSVDGKDVPVMFHNIWGLRTVSGSGEGARSGRAVIGKAVVTTLRPGAEHKMLAAPAGLLERVGGLAVLPPK